MSLPSSENIFAIEGMSLSKTNVSGFEINEYCVLAIKDISKPYWSFKKKQNLRPEALITNLLEDNNFIVIGQEGLLLKQFYDLMCLIAYEEYERGPMVRLKAGITVISLRPCMISSPSEPFTLEYMTNILTSYSIDEIIEYLEIFGQLLNYDFPGFKENDLELIYSFLDTFTLERMLDMFKLALESNSALSGWPDITAIKNNNIYFIEVKTTDSLTKNQQYWLSTFKNPMDLNYRIIRLKQNN